MIKIKKEKQVMNKKYFAAAALACALMSCGTGKNSVAVVDFTGEWNIVEVNGEKVSAENAPFLGFDKNGHRLYGNAGCNRLMGSFELDTLNAGKVKFGQVAATRMMCPDMTLEQNVLEALNKVAGYETVGEDVALNDAEGKPVILLQKREVAEVSVNDLNGAWEIVSVKGNPVGEVEKQPQLVFNVAEKRVHGNASCNTINGSFTQEEGQAASLRFSQMISTNDETNGNKIIIAATQINFQPFSTIPNKPLCARIGITGNITSAFDSTLNPAGIPALDPAFDDALFP
jgi:heat shock protein HslJ